MRSWARRWKTWMAWKHTPSWAEEGKAMVCLLISSITLTIHLEPYSPHFFNWWFCYSEWPQSIMVRCCLVFPSARRQWCALWRKYLCWMFHVCMSYVAIGHKFNVRNQQYILNMVSRSRNTPNIRYVWSAGKNVVDRSSQESNPVPHQRGNDSVLTNSILLITLQSITTSKNKRRNYFV